LWIGAIGALVAAVPLLLADLRSDVDGTTGTTQLPSR
jgi:hypothetical protein